MAANLLKTGLLRNRIPNHRDASDKAVVRQTQVSSSNIFQSIFQTVELNAITRLHAHRAPNLTDAV